VRAWQADSPGSDDLSANHPSVSDKSIRERSQVSVERSLCSVHLKRQRQKAVLSGPRRIGAPTRRPLSPFVR
jgi:hypothetical protein